MSLTTNQPPPRLNKKDLSYLSKLKFDTRKAFEDFLLNEHGLNATLDPRISQVIHEKLGDRISINETDIIAITGASTLISRALRRRLIVSDFSEFRNAINIAFENAKEARSNDAKMDGLGENAQYIPPLSSVDPNQRIISICTTDGQLYSRFDGHATCKTRFTVQSVSKVLTYAIAVETLGQEKVHKFVGKEPSGKSFNSLALDSHGKPHNPFINAGAIRVAEMVFPEMDQAEMFDLVKKYWTDSCLEPIGFSSNVFLAERETADRNFCLAYMMRESKCIPANCDIEQLVLKYLSFCSLESTCEQLSIVAATLSNGGVNPFTGKRVFSEETARNCFSLMASCGMYDGSGSFQMEIGIPAKSGVSGVLLCCVPWKYGFATFSPRLDRAGNSVFGIEFCREVVNQLQHVQHGNLLIRSVHMPPDILNKRRLLVLFLNACARGDLIRVRELIAVGAPFHRKSPFLRNGLDVTKSIEVKAFLLRLGLDHDDEGETNGHIGSNNDNNHHGQTNLDSVGDLGGTDSESEGGMSSSESSEMNNHHKVVLPPPVLTRRTTSKETMIDSLYHDFTRPRSPIPNDFASNVIDLDLIELAYADELGSDTMEHLITTKMINLGLDPSLYVSNLPLIEQHPSVLKAITGKLAIPDWENFLGSIKTVFDFVKDMKLDESTTTAQYSSILSEAPMDDFNCAICTIDGQIALFGNCVNKKISLQSVFKPFAYALALETLDDVDKFVSCEPSGRSFRDLELNSKGVPFNPMVNSGGLAIASALFPGVTSQSERFAKFIHMLSRCCTSDSDVANVNSLEFSPTVFLGEMQGAYDRLMLIGHILRGAGVLKRDSSLKDAVEYYFLLCSIMCDVKQVACLAATFANGGKSPFTLERIFMEDVMKRVLVCMLSSGLAEYSGTHSFNAGFPAKSGVSGLTFGVIEGIGGIAIYSPGLDNFGNSVKANLFFQKLSETYRVHLYSDFRRYTSGISLNRYFNEKIILAIGDLLFASARGDVWFIRELLSRRTIDVNVTDYDGRTALHFASYFGRIDSVKCLIELGANPSIVDSLGHQAKEYAIENGHGEVANLLENIKLNANVDI